MTRWWGERRWGERRWGERRLGERRWEGWRKGECNRAILDAIVHHNRKIINMTISTP
jgi:hypothetical protein